MGVLVLDGRRPDTAPRYFFNHCGSPSWSGCSVSEMTAQQCIDMLQFCRDEGYRAGWNDSLHDRVDVARSNMFNDQFAGGLPYAAWEAAYLTGTHEQTLERS